MGIGGNKLYLQQESECLPACLRSPLPSEVCAMLWEFLSAILGPRGSAFISSHLLQACIAAVSASQSGADEMCTGIVAVRWSKRALLLSPPPPILYKYDLLVTLVEASLKLCLTVIRTEHPSGHEVASSLTSLLHHYTYVQGTQANPKKVFTSTCTQLLESMLLLWRLLIKYQKDGEEEENWQQLEVAIDEAIMQLYSRDHLPEFTSALEGSSFEDALESCDKRSATSYVKVMLHTLRDMARAGGESQETVHITSSLMLKCFLDQNRKENTLTRSVEFQFLFKLLSFLGHSTDGSTVGGKDMKHGGGEEEEKERDKEITEKLLHAMMNISEVGGVSTKSSKEGGVFTRSGLDAVLQCLQLAQEYEVYQAVDDGAGRHLVQLQALAKDILHSYCNNEAAVVGCVHVLMRLNHKGVEPFLPALWGLLFCRPAEVQAHLCGFAEDCIHTYAKLKQLGNLVGMQLMALRVLMGVSLTPTSTPALTRQAEQILCRHVQELPHGQCVEVMEVLSQALQDEYLPKVHLITRSKRRKASSKFDGVGEETGALCSADCLSACLLKVVDMFGAVVCSVPLDVWGSGLQKEKAKNVLNDLVGTLCPQLMEASCSLPSLATPALYLSYLVCQVTSCLMVIHPSVVKDMWPLPLVWSEERQSLVPRVWEHTSSVTSILLIYSIMKHIAVLCLKFGEEHVLQKELIEYVFAGLSVSMATNTHWSGQLLDVTDQGLPMASLQLLLSQFPVLYHHCDSSHLRRMADAMLHSLLSWDPKCESDGCTHPVVAFLQTPEYQDMRGLHEALIDSVMVHSASKAPKSLHQDIRCALEWTSACAKSEGGAGALECSDVFSPVLTCALHEDGEENGRGLVLKVGKRSTQRYMNYCGAYVQILSSIPLQGDSLTAPALVRVLVSCTCWHVVAVHLLLASSEWDDDTLLCRLASLLACALSSLSGRRGKKRKRGVCPPDTLIPADLLARWCYVGTRDLAKTQKGTAKSMASSLVAIEKCVHWSIVNSSSCEGMLKEVATDIHNTAPSGEGLFVETSLYSDKCVGAIVSTLCKMYKEYASSPQSCLIGTLQLVVDIVTKEVKQLVPRPPPLSRLCHPALLSSFAELVTSCAQLLSPISVTYACALYKDVTTNFEPSTEVTSFDQCDQTLAVLDILALPVYILDLAVTQDSVTLPDNVLCHSWMCLHSQLSHLLHHCEYRKAFDIYKELKGSKCRKEEEFGILCETGEPSDGEYLHAVIRRLLEILVQFMGVTAREQTKTIFEHITETGTACPVSLSAFCLCWNIILDSKLTEDSQRELRIWLCKVLLHCLSALSVYANEPGLIAMVAEMIARLVSIPSQVGLDARSVIISLHTCFTLSTVSTKPSNDSVQLLNAVCHLLSAVVRNHPLVTGACPAAVITSVNKLVEAVLKQAQEIGRQSEDFDDRGYPSLLTITHCVSMVSRLLEAIAKHAVLAKFVPYSVISFTVSLRTHPLNERVKQALLPGICSLIRMCTDRDSAFIKAMLGQGDREGYMELVEEYKTYHKYTGRV